VDFAFTEEQNLMRDTARKLTEKFDVKYWREIDENSRFPEEFWESLRKHGFLGITIPTEYGGAGLGLLEMTMIVDEIAQAGGGLDGSSPFLNGPVFGSFSIAKYASLDQKKHYLPRLVRGDVLSLGLTEPEAGSNITRIKTEAKRHGAYYVLNGQKIFISMMRQAKMFLIVARTTPYDQVQRKTHGMSLFLADLPNPNVTTSLLNKCGMHSMDTNEVWIRDLEIPAENILGEEGQGWNYLLDVLNPERIIIAACAVGTGLLVVRKAVEYAKQRVVWDRPIGAHQGIQFPLADALTKLEAARLIMFKAAWLFDKGLPCGVEAAVAKVRAVEAASEATDRAMQTFGGYGYMREMDVERHWRNVRLLKLAPITQEMSLNYIAHQGLGLPRSY